jgi:hypothetical protein
MAEAKKIRPRSRPRVEGDGLGNTVAKSAQHRTVVIENVPEGRAEITVQASELVPVAQFANVTIGPIAVRTVIPFDDLDDIKNGIKELQGLISEVIADDRELVDASIRLHNLREAEKEKEAAKGRGK